MSKKEKEERLDSSETYKVAPDSERTRKVQEISGSLYSNIPKSWVVQKAKSLGLSLADFLVNYELVIAEVVPEGGNIILDGELMIAFRRIKDE